MNSEPINVLTIQFANEISSKDLTSFRGAVINSMAEAPLLLHNHLGDTFRYSYPLVQYKRINNKAAIVCVGKGTDSIRELLDVNNLNFHIRHKDMEMRIESFHLDLSNIEISDEIHYYRIHKWLPLNSNNYEVFQNTENLVDKIVLLEKILVGNILSFLKGIEIRLENQINLHISNISNRQLTSYKNIKLMAFDVEFNANITLPQFIGIGKNASVGYGVLKKNDSPKCQKHHGESSDD